MLPWLATVDLGAYMMGTRACGFDTRVQIGCGGGRDKAVARLAGSCGSGVMHQYWLSLVGRLCVAQAPLPRRCWQMPPRADLV